MNRVFLIIGLIIMIIPLAASQRYVLGEVFSGDPGC